MNIQFKKGVLELCVLSLLEKNNYYGYEIASTLVKVINISDGTVYPILRRLKQENYVSSYLEESNEGPPRKYYTLTQKGTDFLEVLKAEWKVFSNQVNRICFEGSVSCE